MLEFSIILIILLALSLSTTFKYLDDMVLEFKKELEACSCDVIFAIRELRKDLKTLNASLKIVHKLQTTRFFDLTSRIFDVLGLVMLFLPAKNKRVFFKKMLSVNFVSKLINVIRAI